MNAFYSFDLFMVYILYQNVSNNYKNYEMIPGDNEMLNTLIWAVVLLLTRAVQ
jgi:hypothetical protein